MTSKSGCRCLQQEVALRKVPAMIFDWEHFVVFDRLACVAYSLEDGRLQGVAAPECFGCSCTLSAC